MFFPGELIDILAKQLYSSEYSTHAPGPVDLRGTRQQRVQGSATLHPALSILVILVTVLVRHHSQLQLSRQRVDLSHVAREVQLIVHVDDEVLDVLNRKRDSIAVDVSQHEFEVVGQA